jgi:hypothetical protein
MGISKSKFWFLGAFVFVMLVCPHSFAVTDILFLVDSTGSMNGLSTFKTAFKDIITALRQIPVPKALCTLLPTIEIILTASTYLHTA